MLGEGNNVVWLQAYRLINAGVVEETILEHPVLKAVIEPVLGSICHADLRYFTC